LAVAWTVFRVYHDPRTQDAFRRAVATLGSLPAFPWTVDVQSDGFRWAGRPVPTRRQAAPALARALFARGIAALGFSAAPTPDDLIHLFEVVSFQEAPGGSSSPADILAQAGAARLIVIEHGRLAEIPQGLEEAEALVAPGDDPSAGRHQGDPSRRYLEDYRRLYERLQAGDFQGLQELVHEFTDAFFALPQEQQTLLFGQFLERHEEEPFRLLLDQFSQGDLAELARLLSPGTHPLLVEYARIAAEQEGRTEVAGDLLTADQLVSDRISRMLRAGRTELRRQVGEVLRAQIPSVEASLHHATWGAAAILALTDEAGFLRLAHALASKAADALEGGELPRAAAWARTLLAAARSRERKEAVRREMEAALRPGTVDRLVDAVTAAPGDPDPEIVTLVALFAADQVIERLAAEEDMGRRRALAGLLAAVARRRPGPLIRRLADPRWYLVRNLVEILSHSARPEAAAGLRAACGHADHRVRREALRALFLIDRREAAAAAIATLRDPEPALRLQALGLLAQAGGGSEVDTALTAFLESRPPLEERLAVIEVLGRRRNNPHARAALRRAARRRLFASASAREARRRARRLLEGEPR
jgi:hypothetical protein